VIFLRPIVIKDASIDGDYSAYRSNLPDSNFLKPENEKAKP
jgi:general secretion pathway protein D